MIHEWIAEGAAFGIKAFAALFMFALICAAVLGLLAIGAKVLGGDTDAKRPRRPY